MLKNKKLSIGLFLLALVVLVGAGVWIGMAVVGGNRAADPAGNSGYSAVYMVSGDIYFGKLHSFPQPYLSDALYVTRSTNKSNQTQLGLASFKSAFWNPVGEIYFNPSQVLFTAPLRNDSQIVAAIQNPSLLNAASQSGSAQSGATAPAENPAAPSAK